MKTRRRGGSYWNQQLRALLESKGVFWWEGHIHTHRNKPLRFGFLHWRKKAVIGLATWDKIAKPETQEENWPIKPLLDTQMVSNLNTITPEVKKFIPPLTLAKSSVTQVSTGIGHSHRGRESCRYHCSELDGKANPGFYLYQSTSGSLIPKRCRRDASTGVHRSHGN